MPGEQDWRLKAQLAEMVDTGGTLDHLLRHLRRGGGPYLVHDLGAAIPHDVVLTHDGRLLFAYAADEETLTTTRHAIEGVLTREGIEASIFISHWDDELDAWRQTDPPVTATERQSEEARERDAETVETRTMVASSGKMIRASFEQSMLEWAGKLGVQCTILEHPQLLTTQVGFTVTGRRRKLDEFSEGLKAEEASTMRTEGMVMLSPL
jgi:hypothetical protein